MKKWQKIDLKEGESNLRKNKIEEGLDWNGILRRELRTIKKRLGSNYPHWSHDIF